MTNTFLIFSLVTIVLLASCKTNKSSSSKTENDYENISLFAWNEDSIHSYQLALTKDNRFLYTITKMDSVKKEEYYHGIILNQPSLDTIFLRYDGNIRPHGLTNYLIKEVSGGYLIQAFENDVKRLFLRIQRLGHKF